MKKNLAVKKNLHLLNEFMKYAFDNPDVLEKITPEAELVILPIDDWELCEYNRKMANKLFSQGKEIVIVKMKKPELPVPEVELMMTATG
jgi:siroheme synthase (precorrin-2 oxidase/ferrochelatase)